MRTGAGTLSTSAGSNSNWRTAATAASSKPWPAGCVTWTSVTAPVSEMSMFITTVPSSCWARASEGYCASTWRLRTGALVSTPLGVPASAGGVPASGAWAKAPVATRRQRTEASVFMRGR